MYQTTEDIIREAEQRKDEIFTKNNRYGYQLNVSNRLFGILYEEYITRNRIHRPMGDGQRMEWERQIWVYLSKLYRREERHSLPDYDSGNLSEQVIGWQKMKLADLVNCRIVPEKAVKQLYGGKK